MVADIDQSSARALGGRVDGSHSQGQLAADEIEIPPFRNIVHPTNGISHFGGLLAGGAGGVHGGLPALNLGEDELAGVAHRLAEARRVRQRQVRERSEEGGRHAHEERQRERVHRERLRDVEPPPVPAQLRAQEDARRHTRDDLEHVLPDQPRGPLAALTEHVVDAVDGLVYEVCRHQAQRLRQLYPDCVADQELVLGSLSVRFESWIVDEEVLRFVVSRYTLFECGLAKGKRPYRTRAKAFEKSSSGKFRTSSAYLLGRRILGPVPVITWNGFPFV